jgi:hypothetical protein
MLRSNNPGILSKTAEKQPGVYMKLLSGSKNCFFIQTLLTSILFVIGLLFMPVAHAAEMPAVNPQYQIEIPMKPHQGQNGQALMIQQALSDLLVRLSGSERILDKPGIKNAIAQADRYSKQISYHQPSPALRTIRVQFKEGPVRNLIANANEKVWDQKRPLTLAVLIMENGKKSTWVGQDFSTQAMQEIQTLAAKRGLLIVFPMLDLTDTGQVSEQDIKQGHLEKVQALATRYNSDVIWTGKIHEADGKYTGEFTTIKQDKDIEFEAQGDNLEAMLNNALEQLSQTLRGINPSTLNAEINSKATPNLPSKPILLTITGSLDGERYVKVMNYLMSLPSVTDVIVEQISADKTVFSVETPYSKEEMASCISKDPILVEQNVALPSPAPLPTERNLIYKLSEAL